MAFEQFYIQIMNVFVVVTKMRACMVRKFVERSILAIEERAMGFVWTHTAITLNIGQNNEVIDAYGSTRNTLPRSVDRCHIEIFRSDSIGVSAQPRCKDIKREATENADC